MKALAIREIEKMEFHPVKKIALYQELSIDRNLLFHSYADLCCRDSPITPDEAKDLGLVTTLHIMRAREIARGQRLDDGGVTPSPLNVTSKDLGSLISGTFNLSPLDIDLGPLISAVPKSATGSPHAFRFPPGERSEFAIYIFFGGQSVVVV